MLYGQDIYRKKQSHEAPEYICTVTSESIAFNFCLKHRGEGYYYEKCIICESLDDIHFQNFRSYPRLKFVLEKLVNFEASAPIDTSELNVKEICSDISEDDAIKLGNFTLEGIDLCMDIEADSNEEFIDKRTEKLIDLILRVWEYPTL